MEIVLDTCALIWATSQPEALSATARGILEDAEHQFLISSISIWEIALKTKRGTIDMGVPLPRLVRELCRRANVAILPVDAETWLRNVALPWEHRDPADRTIVASAELRNAPILTCDDRIASYYPHVIW
jgi:PIN domain nuclease of toxin-antitoxin system